MATNLNFKGDIKMYPEKNEKGSSPLHLPQTDSKHLQRRKSIMWKIAGLLILLLMSLRCIYVPTYSDLAQRWVPRLLKTDYALPWSFTAKDVAKRPNFVFIMTDDQVSKKIRSCTPYQHVGILHYLDDKF
jgi:hypothetical protein